MKSSNTNRFCSCTSKQWATCFHFYSLRVFD